MSEPLLLVGQDGTQTPPVDGVNGSFKLLFEEVLGYVRMFIQLLIEGGFALLEELVFFIDLKEFEFFLSYSGQGGEPAALFTTLHFLRYLQIGPVS